MIDECVRLRGRALGLDLDGLGAKRARHEAQLIQQNAEEQRNNVERRGLGRERQKPEK